MTEERDVLLATLTVKQTLAFAVSCRTPPSSQRKPGQNRKQFVKTFLDVLGEIFDLAGVYNTRVGNELIRGISGECSEPLHARLGIDNKIFPLQVVRRRGPVFRRS